MTPLGRSPDRREGAREPRLGRGRRGTACALVIAALLCPSSAGLVHAEDGGAREFLLGESTASRPAPAAAARPVPALPATAPRAAPRTLLAAPGTTREARRTKPRLPTAPAVARAQPAPRAVYASLPRAERRETSPTRRDTSAREPKRAAFPDVVTALLNDSTLRAGDVVIFPDGPKVFKGGQAPFQRAAFEDIRRSNAVSGDTRKAVLALGAAPARRSSPAAAEAPSLREAAGGRSAVAGVRVVYPVR